MQEIKPAKELLDFSKARNNVLVMNALKGLRERIIQACNERATDGCSFCSIDFEYIPLQARDTFLEKCAEILFEFEVLGYKCSIDDISTDKYTSSCILTVSWGIFEQKCLLDGSRLYDTFRRIINRTECV